MKKIIISLLALLAVTAVQANNDYAKYYQNLPVQMPQPTLPTIPDNQVSILDCGGKGDGLTLNTEAFAKAISQLNKQGGGHLNVPAGIYLTGLISLKDNIDLHLEKNAIIVFSEDKNDLIKVDKTTGVKELRAATAITASKRKNISITGEGTIDGNGEWWRAVKRSKVSDVEWKQFQEMGGSVSAKGDLVSFQPETPAQCGFHDGGAGEIPQPHDPLHRLSERSRTGCHPAQLSSFPHHPYPLPECHHRRHHREMSLECPERRRHRHLKL